MRNRGFRLVVLGLSALAISIGCGRAALADGDDPAVEVTFSQTTYAIGRTFPDAITVTVKSGGQPISGDVTVEILGSRVRVADKNKADDAKSKLTLTTDTAGLVRFQIDTTKETEKDNETAFPLSVKAEIAGPKTTTKTFALSLRSGFQTSFLSDRISSEVFLGGSFARSYDTDGKSQGFHERSFVGRARFDTLWTRDSTAAVHTGLEIQFSSFPTNTAPNEGGTGFTEFADAFTGSLVVVVQPGGKCSWYRQYTKTSHNQKPELKFDALRLGLIARWGLTSRERKGDNGDTDLQHFRAGLLFTHHQTEAEDAAHDNVNVFPMRYVEISYGRYEQIFDQKHANRLVIEAGLRLPGIGNDAIPFYAGIYLNAGRGQDDLRIFAGLLFQVNKIAEIFAK